jgi:catechol 2,3-dioxygenase-like lactoylglutathione lyase family enzyme
VAVSFHHLAIATRDLEATHRFYTEVMGFDLAKVVVAETMEGGWARHVFYDTHRGGLMAFWDIHDGDDEKLDFDPSISRGLGLPTWTNHIAFDAPTLADLDAMKRRWLDHGETVAEIDHGWCTSIYITDPNKIMVEFCTSTRELTDTDRAEAEALLFATKPPLEDSPDVVFHEPSKTPA